MRANTLISKLECYVQLSTEEKNALHGLFDDDGVKVLAPRQDLIRENDTPRRVNLIVDGWAGRYIDLEDGRRQIAAIMLPGDLCDAGMSNLRQMDHSIGALTTLRVAEVRQEDLDKLRARFQRIDMALQWHALVEISTARQWILCLGHRSGPERLAHLFLELLFRLRSIGRADENSYDFPLTQQQIGEAMGLSAVHVNRCLMQLRADDLILRTGKDLIVKDVPGLSNLALFNPGYLHLDREGRAFDATANARWA